MTDGAGPYDHSRRRALLGVLLLSPALCAVLWAASEAGEGAPAPIAPKPADKCPVCGMFVAKYPDWMAQAIYRDGSYAVFDGAKDLFKYLFNLPTYAPTKRATDIAALYVTDYYSLSLVDGKAAWYVLGSDVLGPMGRELIPVAAEKEARQFMVDHKGKRLLRFAEVAADALKGLD